jgi:hypothetical protein
MVDNNFCVWAVFEESHDGRVVDRETSKAHDTNRHLKST